jgi:hypothetical protein
MNWLAGAALGGIVGLIAQVAALTVSQRYADRVRRTVRHFRFRWIHNEKATLRIRPRSASVLPEYFNEAGSEKLDIAVYELSLRPRIPLMDLLYFEYLKLRLTQHSIQRLFIVPWSGNGDSSAVEHAEQELTSNLNRIFGTSWSQVTLINSAKLSALSSELLENNFMSSLEALGDSSFLAECSRVMGHRFKSYHDINQGHPEALQARSLVEHAIRGWLIYRYLERNLLEDDGRSTLAVGSLIWERELSKLLLLRNLQLSKHNIRLGLMLGKSVTFRRKWHRSALPTYESSTTIEIFAPPSDLLNKCTTKSVPELSTTNDVVGAILRANHYELDFGHTASPGLLPFSNPHHNLGRQGLITYHGLMALRRMYGLDQ